MNISSEMFENAKAVAALWQRDIEVGREHAERKFHAVMKQMLKDPLNKIFLIELLDQSFRSHDPKRIADQLEYLFSKYENTELFTPFETLLITLFRHFGLSMPHLSVPLFIRYLRHDISRVVIKGEKRALKSHLRDRRKASTRVNLNLIGESVLGEAEAQERVEKYIKALEDDDIDYVSIKISTLFSQITPLAYEWTLEKLSQRLALIYKAAMDYPYKDAQGKTSSKFVNLDMEEYRDLSLTVDLFMQTLSQEAFFSLKAGIVIQAYLPDALESVKKLSLWAKRRVQKGGAPIKLRLVKGANQEMELTEAALRGWPCVTYLDKAETDANFKLIMDYIITAEVAPYVHVGIASHNLFDQALGMLLAKERGVQSYYSAEMLEGMSEAAYERIKEEGLEVILYAPTATLEAFTNAIAYLVRRFDENTAEKNFLRHSFGLSVGSAAWKELLKGFDESIALIPTLRQKPFRTQNRLQISHEEEMKSFSFKNESDTDFGLEANRKWAEKIRDKWKNIGKNGGFQAHPVIAGELLYDRESVEVMDKSQYHEQIMVGRFEKAHEEDLHRALKVAEADPDGWSLLSLEERHTILRNVALKVAASRGDLIGVAAAEVGKVFSETDVEVSEAIDFLNFYPLSVERLASIEGLHLQARGVGLVVSPWNFPIAIAAGGMAAALAGGNRVILKPSSDAVLSAYRLCQCFWEGGVSQNSLQFVPVSGASAGRVLIPSRAVDFVIFTGSEATAYEMIKSRPDIHLNAETGGKDATIVTALADRDQALKNVVASAFNNSGQKCSATSLLVVEKELYEDKNFKRMLIDAAASLEVGSVWEFKNRIGALVGLPQGKLRHALDKLDAQESWVLPPSYADKNNPYMLRPAIRWGTQRGDFCHKNELFGPVLSVICAKDLEDAIAIVNETGYGLTSGLESLDEREQKLWKSRLRAGNLYINRMTTGAIVLRQPFGGMGKSAIGSGKKAGGYNYVSQFMKLHYDHTLIKERMNHPFASKLEALLNDRAHPADEIQRVSESTQSFAYWLDREFLKEHDYTHLRGERNFLRYLPVKSVLLRVEPEDSIWEVLASIAAVKMVKASLYLSLSKNCALKTLSLLTDYAQELLYGEDSVLIEDTATLVASIESSERIRFLQPNSVPESLYESVADKALHIACEPFIAHGRIELMHYFVEQSISDSYHRYGNLGRRGFEQKQF